jgi:hypothetical protein
MNLCNLCPHKETCAHYSMAMMMIRHCEERLLRRSNLLRRWQGLWLGTEIASLRSQ